MIKKPATRIVAAAVLLLGLAVAPLLDKSDPPATTRDLPIRASTPKFVVHWQREVLELSGHTRSTKHEQDLIQLANTIFGKKPVVTQFEPLGIVPEYWADLTLQVLYLLAETSSAEAVLAEERLEIHGVIVNDVAWQSRLNAIRNALPENVVIDANTLFINDTVNLATVCGRAFDDFQVGPINFEESSADFRSSAYPRLERLVALASACNDSRISITGHTDATGNVAWNQGLSLQRANAVGNYLIAGGVDRARLVIAGAGSSKPIADDSTRYGRSLNRRIDVEFSFAEPSN